MKDLEVLDALTDVLGRSDDQSIGEVKDELREEGVDIEEYEQRMRDFRAGLKRK